PRRLRKIPQLPWHRFSKCRGSQGIFSGRTPISARRTSYKRRESHTAKQRQHIQANRRSPPGCRAGAHPVHRQVAQRAASTFFYAAFVAKRLKWRGAEGRAFCNLGNAHNSLGESRRDIEFYERTLAIAREPGDRRGEGGTLGTLG